MRPFIALRRLGVVAATSALVAGLPVTPALAVDTITNVTPTGAANTGTPTVEFDVAATYSAVPIPTVKFIRQADASEIIEIAPDDVTYDVVDKHISVPVPLTRRNPGPWNIEVSGTVVPTGTVVNSCTDCFEVLGFTPTVSSINPTSLRITQSGVAFTVTGTNFTDSVYCVSGDCTGQPTVTVSGTDVTLANTEDQLGDPVPATATTIPLTVSASSSAASGFRDITVTNTDGKTATCEDCLLIKPNVASVTYPAATGVTRYGQGAKNRRLVVAGHGFQTGAVVSFQTPAGITIDDTDVVNATTINVDVTLNEADSSPPTAANHAITVTNPDTGIHASGVNFTIFAGPVLTSVSPLSRGRGATANLTLTGTGFSTAGVTVTIPGVTVNSYGTPTANSVVANVTIPSGATAGPRDVTIMNNNDKGQHTCEGCFTVDNLQVDAVSPNNVLNDASNELTVTGSGFAPDATLTLVKSGTGAGTIADIPGTDLTVNEAGTQITATFATTGVAPGTWQPRVVNPTANAGTGTCTCSLNIAAVAPNISTVSPDDRGAGADNETITITGTGFLPGATVSFSNTGVHVVGTPTVTSTQITAVIDIDGNATPDSEEIVSPPTISVTNTDAQADTADFRVNTGPTATSLDKTARAQGTATTITFSGEDLVSGATVTFGGTGVTAGTWTFTAGNGVNTPDTLAATVTVAPDAEAVARSVTVRNPDGGRAVCACTLMINPQPNIDEVTPAKAASGQTTVLTVTGDGFLSGATVAAGTGITPTVTNVTSNALTVSLAVAAGTATGNRVLTVNNPDGGSDSEVDAFKVFTVPGAPTGATATRGTGSASVSWTAPESDGNDPITGYTVTSSPGGLTATVDGTTLNAVVSGLTNGTSYTFTVVATNPAGNSAASAASNAVVPATVPDAPTGVSASSGNTTATVTWTVPAFNGGSAITGYTVTSSPGGLTKTVTGAAATNGTVEGLTNGTSYTFTVVATNDIGDSVPSAVSNTVVPSTVPDAPTSVSATPSDSSALVSWTVPGNGGSPITGYTVTSSPGGHTANAAGDATSANVTGLTNGTPYTFTVTATNTRGTSVASAPSAAVTPFTIPGAPTDVTATASAASANVSWVAPSTTNGSPITGYTVTSNPGGHTATVDGSTLTAKVTGLTPGATYTFTVVATNAAGNSVASAASNSVIPFDVPGAPTAVSAVRGNQAATVSWTAPASNGGSPLTGFTVTSSPGGITKVVNDATATSTTVTGLTNGTAYTFTVVASNAGGSSAPSTASNSVTPAGAPLVPPSVTATAGHAAATVTWTAPSGNGSPVTSYTVTVSPGGRTRTLTGTSTTFTGLTNGTLYTFAVKATNAVGTGPAKTSNGVRPTWVTRLSEGATTVLVAGGTATVSGKLTRSDGVGIVGATVRIYRRISPSTTYTFVRTVTTGTGGAWKVQFSQTRNTRYQARFAGSTGYDAVNSPVRLTLARYRLSLTYSQSGRTLTAKGSVFPNAAGRAIYLQHRRADGSFVTLRSGTVASNGTYTLTRTLPAGTYNVRVLIGSSTTNYANATTARSVRIT